MVSPASPTSYTGIKTYLTAAVVPGKQTDPTTSDLQDPLSGKLYVVPTIWVNENTDTPWIFAGSTGGSASWIKLATPGGADVAGPASATDNAIARFDGTTGKIIQNSAVTIADTTGAFGAPSGTVALPTYSFTGDTDTGIYRIGANNIGIATNGAKVVDIGTASVGFPDGTVALPGITFFSDTDCGLYVIGANNIGFATNGVQVMDIGTAAILFPVGTVALPGISFIGDPDTGVYLIGANDIGIATAGVLGLEVNATQDVSVSAGNLTIAGSAKQLRMQGGAETDFIGQTGLTAGVATVNNTNIAAGDRIFIQRASINGSTALGSLTYTISAGASFTITSVQAAAPAVTETNDTSVVVYHIIREI